LPHLPESKNYSDFPHRAPGGCKRKSVFPLTIRKSIITNAWAITALFTRLHRRNGHQCSPSAGDGEILLLENIRFPKEEMDNNDNFSTKLDKLAETYVTDAFGTAHRAHASTAGVAKYLWPGVTGF
jgi:3-phosphoglycerate kinase